MRGIAALRRFVDVAADAGVCDVCGSALAEDHGHVVKAGVASCVCANCGGDKMGKAGRVVVVSEDAGDVFAGLGVPVDVAYVVRDAQRGLLIRYPSPAGIVEGPAPADVGEFDVDEAMLFATLHNRVVQLRVPLAEAFAVTGLLRAGWSGLSGAQARADVAVHIAQLRERACRA